MLKKISFRKNLIVVISIALFFIAAINLWVFAQEQTTDDTKVEDLQEDIDKYTKKINDLNLKEASLSKEIDLINAQISLTQLRIQNSTNTIKQKESQIVKLAGNIDDLAKKIEKLEASITYQNSVLQERMRSKYKSGVLSPFMILFGSKNLDELVKTSEYLTVLGLNDKKLMEDMSVTKKTFGVQKTLFEETKSKEEDLKKQLERERSNHLAYKNQLDDQNEEKKDLLERFNNDEAKYQELLAEAQQELNQITGAVGVLKDQKPRDVKQGELIGYQGNTGYSNGEHLHFGVYKYDSFTDIDGWNWYYSNYVDPAKKLKSKSIYWDTGCEKSGYRTVGGGSWSWPISTPTISQGFGVTCWSSRLYGGKPHPAWDMYGSYGTPIYAAAEGKAYFCKNCLGDGANGVFIFHPDGYMSLYWHLR